MEPVRSLAVKGLIEGLVLHAIERAPTHGYGIIKDLEDALGERPSKNQVYPLLRDLEDEGYIEAQPVEDAQSKQVYGLTEKGTQRLAAYRSLPHPFKQWISGVFGVQAGQDGPDEPDESRRAPDDGEGDQPPAREPGAGQPPSPVPRARGDGVGGDWVAELTDALPRGAPVRAPYAEISIERSPRTDTWSLTVENHDPGSYDGSEACPLTFLYVAMHRLLFEPPES